MTEADHVRHMEEASVAGESPDRSKQRESSAEPTPGSASPVPEARSSVRDPRLAVARESISLGGIDTATRIFSVREPTAPPEKPQETEEGPAEAGSGASGTGDSETPKGTATTETQDAAEAPEESDATQAPEGAGEPEAPKGAGKPAAPEGAGASEAPEDADAAEASAGAGAGEPEAPESTDAPAAPEDADAAEAPAGASESSEPEETGAAEASEGADATETPARAGGTESSDETGVADGPGGATSAEGSGGAAAVKDSEETAAAEAPGDSSERDAGATDGDSRLRDAVAAWVSKGDRGPDSDAPEDAKPEKAADGDVSGTETDGEPEDAAEPETPADAAPAPLDDTTDSASPGPDAEPARPDSGNSDSPGARGEADRADSGDSDSPGARGTAHSTDDEPARADSGDPDSPGARGTARPAPTGPQADDDAERPVDQPTAVFKAPRPPVDQPTTMLKLGKAAAAAQTKESAPEAEAERTSKFVALKPLDEARPKPDATAVVPQVGPERTTQQPLPPKPPLDLLAELTNTPPPPPSPMRTLGRRVKIWTPLLILLIVAFAIVQAVRPLPNPELSLTAEDSYTFDGSTATLPWPGEGQGWMDVNGVGTMGDFGKQTPVAIGSVAKAMTAYIVLKDHPLKSGEEGAKITVDALAEKEGGYNKDGESTLNTVKQGDVLTEKQAISAIMIPSANNIARLLARWDAGSEAAFIKKMNDTARELGMKNTTYTDASGLKETTVSTAEDQVKLGNELVRIPALMEITSMGQWIDPSGQKWYNYNYLVPYNGAIGIKTGTTTAAGGNLLFAARKEVGGETVTVVGAILGQHKSPIIQTVNDVSKTAMLAAQDALTSAKILKKGDVVGYVDDGLGGHTPVVLTKDVTAVGWAGMKVKLTFAADDVPHAAKAGTKVGTLTVGDADGGAIKVPVTLQKDLTEPGYTAKLTRIS